ncbi:hypothetical protein EKH79_03400 [Dyella dinghuensis]|uniref:SPOR domain-containing protein n=1 Tax=Dyella dinghuensis TaxID=1920169 RepID=A0A3S0S4K4_9GAMM|nr:hypothetical protein [Dyella dinghuensis]RUL65770.1 hypothetical protein EKH79_03400 [Dyella dinghuensis]
MKIRACSMVIAVTLTVVSLASFAQSSSYINNRTKQKGLIDETNDPSAPPLPFKSAQGGLTLLAASNSPFKADDSLASQGLIQYDGRKAKGGPYYFMAFVKGSPYFPSVVRRRLVVATDASGMHFEMRSSIFCGANAAQCERLRMVLNQEDIKCGSAVAGCPGYTSASPAKSEVADPSTPPPPPPGG